ncbi:pentatricopeptide repeat-containing protein At2g01510, mitochondrial [Ricinus communis]|uniref:pentatricopeptide repeat-containing protein At2g01510, mitochondrial n=1 Tax=Ricinus communis TaxID=3988 RepID=UPI00201A7FAC|nr:pentatricopeptide repeat-containing protein At2g01510, mitochondrial [Ricinus communis]
MHRLGSLCRRHSISIFPCALHSSNSSCAFSYTPDSTEIVYDNLVKFCDGLAVLKQIHSALTTNSLITKSPHLAAQIIIKYAKFGYLNCARSLFDGINIRGDNRSSFLWNTMIRAYANAGLCFETLELYMLMRRAGVSSNNYTFPFIFKACASNSLLLQGKVAHGDAVKADFDSDVYVKAALVDMYAKCGQFCDGRKIFDEMPVKDLVCWTAMITAYEQGEKPDEALILLRKMQQHGLFPDEVTMVSVASAIGQLWDAKWAQSVHAYAIRRSFLKEIFVANSILAMHTKCGNMEKSCLIFDMMDERNVISWNSMLSGYTQNGQASEALFLFDKMRDSGCEPNSVTALIMVAACAYLGSRHLGGKFHDFILDSKMKIDMNLRNALINMYAKCGDLKTAVEMFNDVHPSERNVSSWNVLISGYGMHGHGKEALRLYSRMQEESVEPNHITFTSILSACSHAGLIDEGRKCFADMPKLSVTLELKHYACMVDMLGRAGLLQEALDLIKEMPLPPNDAVWGALLLACKIHGNMELGEIAANNLFQLEPDHTGYYVLMSNIYAASNKWQEVGKLREDMKNKGLKKPAAFSVIEYGKEVHGFHTADHESPYWQEVYRKVESLAIEMKIAGHIPDLSCALHDVEEEDKEHILNYHSEKLAVAFGILKIDWGMAIRVTKNLRVCSDCHSAFKFISQIYGRNIIVRDTNRFHHFQGGTCSCKDYW